MGDIQARCMCFHSSLENAPLGLMLNRLIPGFERVRDIRAILWPFTFTMSCPTVRARKSMA